jgi:ribonuclease HII
VFEELEKKPIYIVEGDSKVLEISAASIIAKVFRDKLTKAYGELYPHLGLENHKWYGTKAHSDTLKKPSDITWAHRVSYKPIQAVLESKPKLLLHVCCWPDASIPIVDLKKDYEVIGFWYDPNIQPKKEYDKRLRAFEKVCKIEGIECIEGEYDVKNFFARIKWLEHTPERGDKCTECYDMRLDRTAKLAREMGITYWTSTLNTSPHKDLEKMFELGEKWSSPSPAGIPLDWEGIQKKLEFLKIAFRKNNGFLRSVEYTKKHKIYRQDYCGCVYSDTFPGSPKREKIMKKWGYSGG